MGFIRTCVSFEILFIFITGVQPSPLTNGPNLQPQSLQTPDLQPPNPERDAVVRRFNYFDLELLKEFGESSDNVFISPASIKTTLALILEGAKGNSANEIGNALRIDNIANPETREILARLLFDLNDKTNGAVLESANSLFLGNKYNVRPGFERQINKYYKAAVNKVDFSNGHAAANAINSWASNATHGLINEIVGGNLDPATALILANALYFKGKWKTEFNPKNTKNGCFASAPPACVSTPFMELTHSLNYNFNIDLNAHAIELPYQDDKYAMLILSPTNGNNVRTLARDMQHTQLHEILDALKPTEIDLVMPRFEIDYEVDLIDFLEPLKIQEVFGSKANLSGMLVQEGVKINNMLHKTKVEVNEQGTKAAATTAAVVVPLMGTITQKIVVDQPFIFFIYHKVSRNIIFEGLLAKPKSQVPSRLKTVNNYPINYPNDYNAQPTYARRDDLQRSNIQFQ